MIIGGRRASFLLFAGDIAAFAASLFLTLSLRYGTWPSSATLASYFVPFAFLFALWTLVFYMAGLYGKSLALFPSRVPDVLVVTQVVNTIFAALFFFLVPRFGIAPKTILVLYLVVSLALIFLWRLTLYPRLSSRSRVEHIALIARGIEADELVSEVNGNPRYGIEFHRITRGKALADSVALLAEIERDRATVLVVDTAYAGAERVMPSIYTLTHVERKIHFASFEDLYEEVFDRIPLSRLAHAWFLENITAATPALYRVTKRLIDIVGGLLMGILTVILAPFIFLANRLEDSGPLFVRQERLGQYGTLIRVYKFRSMEKNLHASGEWTNEGRNRVTKVGRFLRLTSLDEFPQFLNILSGELSLIGPRSDILGLAERLAQALPYYDARYLVKPGITGWAQINQQYEPGNVSPQSIEETKTRLAYDFYYLKHRSLGLDIVIALKTVKRMFFRVGS